MAPRAKAKAKSAKSKAKAKPKQAEKPAAEQGEAPGVQKGKKGRKKEVKEQWLDDLGHTLARQGLRIRTVAADGNCFFRACCDQMEGNEHGHLELRKEVMGFIRAHPDDFAPYMEDEEDFDKYCNRLEKDGAWAGLHEQVALIRLKGKLLCIHQAGQPCWTIRPDFPDVPKDADCLHLSYHDDSHYNSVRLADDYHEGPALPIVLGSPSPGKAPEVGGAGAQDADNVEYIRRGTGCEEEAAIAQALSDANGDVDQAIELLVERMGEDPAPAPLATPADQTPLQDAVSCPSEPAQLTSPPASPATPQTLAPPPTLGESSCKEQPQGEERLQPASENPTEKPADLAGVQETGALNEALTERNDKEVEQESVGNDRSGQEAKGKRVKEPEASAKKLPTRNRPCTCGSGRRYKNCCGTVKAAAARRKKAEMEEGLASGKTNDRGAAVEIQNLFI